MCDIRSQRVNGQPPPVCESRVVSCNLGKLRQQATVPSAHDIASDFPHLCYLFRPTRSTQPVIAYMRRKNYNASTRTCSNATRWPYVRTYVRTCVCVCVCVYTHTHTPSLFLLDPF